MSPHSGVRPSPSAKSINAIPVSVRFNPFSSVATTFGVDMNGVFCSEKSGGSPESFGGDIVDGAADDDESSIACSDTGAV